MPSILQHLVTPFQADAPGASPASLQLGQIYGCGQALTIATAAAQKQAPVVVVTSDIQQAQQLEHEIRFFYAQDEKTRGKVYNFPDWETLPYDVFSPHQDIISERLTTLYRLPDINPGHILIVPVATLLQRLSPKTFVQQQVLLMKKGQRINIDDFRHKLEQSGYACVSQVMEHGEFTVRGSIIDLFPSGHELPFRIDLFDDEIDSIRRFDPESQRSLDTIDAIEILPAREFPFNKDAISQFRSRYREMFEGDPTQSSIYNDVSQGIIPGGIEYYLPLFFDQVQSLFDYLPKNTLLFVNSDIEDQIELFWQALQHRYEQRRHDIQRPVLQPEQLYLTQQDVAEQLGHYRSISMQTFKGQPQNGVINLPFGAPPQVLLQPRAQQPTAALMELTGSFSGRILFVAESTGRRETLLEMLHDKKLFPRTFESWQQFLDSDDRLGLVVAPLERGLQLQQPQLCIITEPQLFGERAQQRRRRRARTRDADAIISNLTDLHLGAPVVHEEHGVGRYLGLQKLAVTDIEAEFLTIEYAGGDKLYVPVSSLHLISRYTGADRKSSTCMRAVPPRAVMLITSIWTNTPALRRPSRSRKPKTSSPPSTRCSTTWQNPWPWTGWCAVTWASARPKWPCARPSWPPTPASRWPSWCPPPCWRNSITRTSRTASPTGRSASRACLASRARSSRTRSSRAQAAAERHQVQGPGPADHR